MPNGKTKNTRATARLAPTRWSSSDHLSTVYANQLLITSTGNEFYLVFGELMLPHVSRTQKRSNGIEIKPVAKIAVSHEAMMMINDALNVNIKRFKARQAKRDGK